MIRTNPTPPLTDDQMVRFWTKVARTEGCWDWTGAKDRNGYSLWNPPKSSGARMGVAYRFSLAHAAGEVIPSDVDVDHLCRNRACVNPDHLELVSHQENMRRAAARRTHCSQGHERTPESWILKKNGTHYCRTCSREMGRRQNGYYERRAA